MKIIISLILMSSFSLSAKRISDDRAYEIFELLVSKAEKLTNDVDPSDIFFMPDYENTEDIGRVRHQGPYRELYIGRDALKDEFVLALVICHELGHIYSTNIWSEGMADYYAVKHCLIPSKFIPKNKMQSSFKKVLNLSGKGRVSVANYDHSMCHEMSDDYPTKQQRFDTYMNALEGKDPPKSWYCP